MQGVFRKKGFTMLELLIVIAIMAIIVGISAGSFRSMGKSSALRSGSSEVYASLTDARSKSLAANNDEVHGVHISSTTVTRFMGSTYSAGDADNKVYTFERDVFATSSIIGTGSGGSIIFSRLEGTPSVTGTLYIYESTGFGTTSVVISGAGLIEYN